MDPRVLGARVRISDERKRDASEPAARLARSASDVHSAELARLLAKAGRADEGRAFLSRAMGLEKLRPSQQASLSELAKEMGLAA